MEESRQRRLGEAPSEEENAKSWGTRESRRHCFKMLPRDEVKIKKHLLDLATWGSDVGNFSG